jgi:crossover junction endodeoxyribonuclease RuvC
MMVSMKVLSIDPGYDKCGYAIFEKQTQPHLIVSGMVKTTKTEVPERRLLHIYEELNQIVTLHCPESLAIERLFFNRNTTTALGVSQAVGVIMLLAAQNSMRILELTPSQVKETITGYGKSDKKSVQKMIWLQLGRTVSVQDDDESDAIAVGMAACLRNHTLFQ